MIAGPSEILIIADGSTPADWVAMDLFSQAEHDELAQAILLCPSLEYLNEVEAAIERLLPQMPRDGIKRSSLGNRDRKRRVEGKTWAVRVKSRWQRFI